MVAALCFVALASIAVYAYYLPAAEDPKLADLKQIDGEIRALQEAEYLHPDDAEKLLALREIRDAKFEALPTEKQEQRVDEQMEAREQQLDERLSPRLEAFFAMPPAERLAKLDQIIDNSEAWQRGFQANDAGGRPPGERGAQGPENRERGAGGPGGRGGPEGRGGGRGSWANATPEKRKERERRRLNKTSPDYRAQRTEFVRMVQQRREERGLPPASYRQLFSAFRQLAPPSDTPNGRGVAPPRT